MIEQWVTIKHLQNMYTIILKIEENLLLLIELRAVT